VVAIAASVGGLDALGVILGALPADFPAAVVVAYRIGTNFSVVDQILLLRTSLQVRQAQEGDRLRPGCVYIAPPDHHLLVNADGSLSLSQSPPVHHFRPSAEPLFESVAVACRERAVAVVLTGGDSDGSEGVQHIKEMGGTVIAQDEATSHDFSMPRAAIETGCVDRVLPLREIAATLVRLVGE
jgi:two-component system chemotaxis response regulator CheB